VSSSLATLSTHLKASSQPSAAVSAPSPASCSAARPLTIAQCLDNFRPTSSAFPSLSIALPTTEFPRTHSTVRLIAQTSRSTSPLPIPSSFLPTLIKMPGTSGSGSADRFDGPSQPSGVRTTVAWRGDSTRCSVGRLSSFSCRLFSSFSPPNSPFLSTLTNATAQHDLLDPSTAVDGCVVTRFLGASFPFLSSS
jgi:hypothetical protein